MCARARFRLKAGALLELCGRCRRRFNVVTTSAGVHLCLSAGRCCLTSGQCLFLRFGTGAPRGWVDRADKYAHIAPDISTRNQRLSQLRVSATASHMCLTDSSTHAIVQRLTLGLQLCLLEPFCKDCQQHKGIAPDFES